MACTVEKLAEFLADGVNTKEPLKSRIRECDFAVLDDDSDEPLEVIQTGVSGWYGVKVVKDLGFDTECMHMVADYYGGGCAKFISFLPDDGLGNSPKEEIMSLLVGCLQGQECVTKDTPLFVELNRYVRGTGLPE